MNILDRIEHHLVDVVAKCAPWLAPIPTAYLVGRATVMHLAWPVAIGIVAAAIIEALGLASVGTALTLWDYNQNKRKSDPSASTSLVLALILVGVYFAVATGLTIMLDISDGLATYAPAIFPALSLVGATVLALRSGHRRRLADIRSVKAERQSRRQNRRKSARQTDNAPATFKASNNGNMDALNVARLANRDARMDALVAYYVDHPRAGPTEAGRAIGVTRQTIHNYLNDLERAGRISRNGDGVVVLES